MSRVTTIAVAISLVAAVGLLGVLAGADAPKPEKTTPSAEPEPTLPDVAPAAASAAPEDLPVGPVAPSNSAAGFDLLPDGSKAPPLPDTAPQRVRFGVIQFSYQGAQFAPSNARTKEQARERAKAIVEAAKKDFAAAAAKGDQGSTADAGRIGRGILEPAAEYVLFTLTKGEVSSEPVETPRGFWVLRRND